MVPVQCYPFPYLIGSSFAHVVLLGSDQGLGTPDRVPIREAKRGSDDQHIRIDANHVEIHLRNGRAGDRMGATGCLEGVRSGTAVVREDTLRPVRRRFRPVLVAHVVANLEDAETDVNCGRAHQSGTQDEVTLELQEDRMVSKGKHVLLVVVCCIGSRGEERLEWVRDSVILNILSSSLLGPLSTLLISQCLGRSVIQDDSDIIGRYIALTRIGFITRSGHLHAFLLILFHLSKHRRNCGGYGRPNPQSIHDGTNTNGWPAEELLCLFEIQAAPGSSTTESVFLLRVTNQGRDERQEQDTEEQCRDEGRMLENLLGEVPG